MTGDIKGGFASPLAAQQFGYGDTVAKRQLAAAEKAVKVQEKELPAIKAGVDGLAAKFQFGR